VIPSSEAIVATTHHKTLEDYLALEYPFNVKADPSGGYAVSFPDLPGCFTQFDDLKELPAMVAEARTLWLETAYDQGMDIPLPSYTVECNGKILVRLPKSLHRRLLDQAEREGLSLNQYVVRVLARGDAQLAIEHRLDALDRGLQFVSDRMGPRQTEVSHP
jgi:antitoxin HicB